MDEFQKRYMKRSDNYSVAAKLNFVSLPKDSDAYAAVFGYPSHIAELDREQGFTDKHSPWSFGIAAKHQVFYHNISLAMALGVYLYREMGHNAKEVEKPYYERIGIHYSIPQLNGLSIGCNVKAHLSKADLTEIVISYPIVFKKKETGAEKR